MTYDEFKKAWIWALRESALPLIGLDPIDETLDLRSTDRICKSAVMPFGGQHAEPSTSRLRSSSGGTAPALSFYRKREELASKLGSRCPSSRSPGTRSRR